MRTRILFSQQRIPKSAVHALALPPLLALAVTLAALAPADASPRPASAKHPAGAPAVESIRPTADALFIQRTDAFPGLGNTLVEAQLSASAVEGLHRRQRSAKAFHFHGLELRDDGRGPDAVAGDRLYSGILHFDMDELAAKAAVDRRAIEANGRVPVFDSRKKLGSLPGKVHGGFDLAAFEVGERVSLRPSAWVVDAPSGPDKWVPGTTPLQDHVLMITDPVVVQDPMRTWDPCTGAGTAMGPWTFGHLMQEMANGTMPTDVFIETWLQEWAVPHVINSFTVPQRGLIGALINDWRTQGGGILDPSIAPFRLIAIVGRHDLKELAPAGSPDPWANAGELRFIFGLAIPGHWGSNFVGTTVPFSGGCQAMPFSVIFEYEVPLQSCPAVRDWAIDWLALDGLWGTPGYLPHLEALTHFITQANAVPPKPNGSALNQVRTNEIALAAPWELREFHIDPGSNQLRETDTVDTPHDSFVGTALFRDYALDRYGTTPVLHDTPLVYKGVNFRGANPVDPTPFFHWHAGGLLSGFGHNQERHEASLDTCNGCHGGETATPFVHVDPSTPLPPAGLSGFLTGIDVPDPVTGMLRPMDDLEDREALINAQAATVCPTPLTFGGSPSKALASVPIEELLQRPRHRTH